MASLMAARVEELDSMVAADGDDALNEQRIVCLAATRYAAFMRYWSTHARLSYKELHTHYELQRVELATTMCSPQNPLGEDEGEAQLEALTAEEEGEMEHLSASLAAMLEEGEAAAQTQASQWLKHADLVNAGTQLESVSQEYRAHFDSLRQRLQDLTANVLAETKAQGVLTLARLATRKGDLEEGAYEVLLETLRARSEAARATLEVLAQEDARIFSAEEAQLLCMLQHGTAWDGTDERAQQSQLHMRELGGVQVNASTQNRLALVEFELRAEYQQIAGANELLQRGADKAEVNAAMADMTAKKTRDAAELSKKAAANLAAANAAELRRQEAAPLKYERERARAVQQIALREVQLAFQMQASSRRSQKEVDRVLQEKRAILLVELQKSPVSAEVKALTERQIHVECLREELELRTAYDSFEEGCKICDRYVSEVVQGLSPSTPYTSQLVQHYASKELYLVQQSVYMEDTRRRSKKRIAGLTLKAFEGDRLRALGRPEEALVQLLLDVDVHTDKVLALVQTATTQEIAQLASAQDKKAAEKARLHGEYAKQVGELQTRYDTACATLRSKYDTDRAYLVRAVEKRGDDVDSASSVFTLEQTHTAELRRAELAFGLALHGCFKNVMGKIVAEEATADEIRVLKQRLNNEMQALEEVLEDSVEARTADLLKFQQERRESESKAYEEAGEAFDTRDEELIKKEDEESSAVRADVVEKERQFHDLGGQSHVAILDAAKGASRAIKDSTEDEINELRSEYERDIARLETSLGAKAAQEKAGLKKRLEAKRLKRLKQLQGEGRSDQELKEADLQESEEEIQMMDALSEKLLAEKTEAVAEKRQEAQEAEMQLIAREHGLATAAAKNAQAVKALAQERMQDIRKTHEQRARQLESAMLAERKAQEEALKARLAEKRAAKLRKIDDSAQREVEEARLKKEEHENMLELQRKTAEENELKREQNRVAAEAEEAKLGEQLKQAEIEAAKATAREAAIRAIGDIQARAEGDIALQEVQRMRDLHEKQEEKRRAESEAAKKQGKGKLEERLQAKRQKREREQKEEERRTMEEQHAQQEREAVEREQSRRDKMAWSEKVQEVVDRAKGMGLADLEREEYCFKETLGKGMVPEKQFNEAVNLVQKERHDAEMKAVLTHNFEERIAALKGAVEEVLAHKSKAKIDLVQGLAGNGASDASIAEAVKTLDAEYHAKQVEAERTATSQLEGEHLSKQMDLRQRQLQELAKVVALYTNPASLARLQSSTGRTQEEQLLAYKAKIEAEKKAREAAIAKEREETEKKMREAMQAEMKKVQDDLEEEQRQGEVEFELLKKEMERQKEEMVQKHADEENEIAAAEKAHIMSSFEKEQAAALKALETERKNKKAKLNDRLNRRRNTVAAAKAPPPVVQVAADPAGAAQAVVSSISAKIANITSASAGGAAAPELARGIQLIESKLERIERVIMSLEKNGLKLQPAAGPAPAPAAASASTAPLPSYSDRDEPPPGEAVEMLRDEDVQMADQARLDFGRNLAKMVGLKTLTVRAASCLPPSAASGNAFANSYAYLSAENTLLVHSKRLSSSGDFGLIVVHALSHIKANANDLSNDNDPRFLAEFYKNLKILSQDLYKKSAVNSKPAPGLGSLGPLSAGSPTNRSFKLRGTARALSFGKGSSDINADMREAVAEVDAAAAASAAALVGAGATASAGAGAGAGGGVPADYFTQESLEARMQMYAAQGGMPMYSGPSEGKGVPTIAEMEDAT